MRLVLVGPNSFVARHVRIAARAAGMPLAEFSRVPQMAGQISAEDVVLNFTLDPAYRDGPYREETDCDLAGARLAAEAGAGFVMLSTRRVYPETVAWGAREDGPANGDHTLYGRNKAITETVVRMLGGRAMILRLANVFGMEFEAGISRRTFFGLMLRSLKKEGVVCFDMNGQTRRDFIPVEVCAAGLVQAVLRGGEGTFNLGSGLPTPCRALAGWVMAGFGAGVLKDQPPVKDEFFLCMEAWNSSFGPLLRASELEDYCTELGRNLRRAEC